MLIQYQKPDAFFGQAKQRRLAELMILWREARDTGSSLSPEEQAELDHLVEVEIEAASRRTAAMLRDRDG